MSINDFANNLDDMANQAEQVLADIYTMALSKLDAELNNRIFNEHKDSLDGKIGQYSTKPTLIGAKSFRNKGAASTFFEGKKDEKPSQWRTLKSGKHAYLLEGGYKELRGIQGLPNNEINFQYTGELLKTGIVKKIGDNLFQLVFANKLSENKGRGFEKRRGKLVFSPTKGETDNVKKYIGVKINEFIQGVMK